MLSEQQEIIQTLTDCLEQAKTGRYNGVAIVMSETGFKTNVAIAGFLPGLSIGAAYLNQAILKLLFPQDPKMRPSTVPGLQS